MSFQTERFVYAPLHGMNTILRMFVLGHFCCSQECMKNDRDLIHSADTFFELMARADLFLSIETHARNTPELKILRKIARTLE